MFTLVPILKRKREGERVRVVVFHSAVFFCNAFVFRLKNGSQRKRESYCLSFTRLTKRRQSKGESTCLYYTPICFCFWYAKRVLEQRREHVFAFVLFLYEVRGGEREPASVCLLCFTQMCFRVCCNFYYYLFLLYQFTLFFCIRPTQQPLKASAKKYLKVRGASDSCSNRQPYQSEGASVYTLYIYI